MHAAAAATGSDVPAEGCVVAAAAAAQSWARAAQNWAEDRKKEEAAVAVAAGRRAAAAVTSAEHGQGVVRRPVRARWTKLIAVTRCCSSRAGGSVRA